MGYFIIISPGTAAAELITNSHGFPEEFDDYEDAKAEAETYIENQDAYEYIIVGECTDDRNLII